MINSLDHSVKLEKEEINLIKINFYLWDQILQVQFLIIIQPLSLMTKKKHKKSSLNANFFKLVKLEKEINLKNIRNLANKEIMDFRLKKKWRIWEYQYYGRSQFFLIH